MNTRSQTFVVGLVIGIAGGGLVVARSVPWLARHDSSITSQQAQAAQETGQPPLAVTGPIIDAGASNASLSPAEIFMRASPAVVVVLARAPAGWSQGSGVSVTGGLVITNSHVVAGAHEIFVLNKTTASRAFVARPYDDDLTTDLAVLEAADGPFGSLDAAIRDAPVVVGERVYAIGSPMGLHFTLSEGLLSALRQPTEDGGQLIQITAPLSPGSSGGGLFDASGQLIGITTMASRGSAQNLNFAIGVGAVRAALEATRNSGPLTLTDEEMAGAVLVPELRVLPSSQYRRELRAQGHLFLFANTVGGCAIHVDGNVSGEVPTGHVADLGIRSKPMVLDAFAECPGVLELLSGQSGQPSYIGAVKPGEVLHVVVP